MDKITGNNVDYELVIVCTHYCMHCDQVARDVFTCNTTPDDNQCSQPHYYHVTIRHTHCFLGGFLLQLDVFGGYRQTFCQIAAKTKGAAEALREPGRRHHRSGPIRQQAVLKGLHRPWYQGGHHVQDRDHTLLQSATAAERCGG